MEIREIREFSEIRVSAKFPKFIKFSILPNILSGEIATILGGNRGKI